MQSRPTVWVRHVLAVVLLLLSASATTGAAPVSQTPPPAKPILLTDPVPDPKQEGVIWFPATGHTLRGAFLSYWQQYGGLAQFGYPLTEEFFEPVGPDNKPVQVQYFERNRFEHHPENQPPYDVLLGTLGRDFHPQDPPVAQQPSPALFFPETGHNLSGAFKQYWETHGGLFVHGYPITEPYQEQNPIDGKEYTVQYFERSRFELHPENVGSPYEVLLGLLGRQLSEKKGYPFGWYPQYGRSSEFSWVSGDVTLNVPVYASGPYAGCSILEYTSDEALVEMAAADGYPLDRALADQLRTSSKLVVFGHLGNTRDLAVTCLAYPNATIYVVHSLQANPANPQK